MFPKLHNALWPGVVGKGSPGSEPFIDIDTMLGLTAAASVGGVKFDGVDLFLFAPHVEINATDDDLKQLADKVRSRNLVIGSVVAPVWPPTGGGSASMVVWTMDCVSRTAAATDPVSAMVSAFAASGGGEAASRRGWPNRSDLRIVVWPSDWRSSSANSRHVG